MGLWINYASPDIAGPAIPSILLQPTVHRSFRTLHVGSQVGDAPFPNSGVLDTHPESQDADDHEAVIAVVLGVDDQGCRHGAGGPLDGEGDSMATPWSGQPDQAPSNQRSEGG